jgi:hypothetical protein
VATTDFNRAARWIIGPRYDGYGWGSPRKCKQINTSCMALPIGLKGMVFSDQHS